MHHYLSLVFIQDIHVPSIIAFIVGMSLLGAFLYHAFKFIWLIVKHSILAPQGTNPSIKNKQLVDGLLSKNNHYYTQLPATLKIEFKEQTIRLASRYRWISGDKLPITEEMRILISASAVQLLFGRPDVKQDYYNTIVVYQDKYFNPITKQHHKGEVNNRFIVLSYKHFTEGNANPTDKINLGLHEMAHALDLSIFLAHSKRYHMRRLMDKFINKTYPEFMAMQNRYSNFLREYGKTNLREFFAVAVEHFFEAPQEMLEQTPTLYKELCLLLNQDPAAGLYRGVHPSRLPLVSNSAEQYALSSERRIYITEYSPKLVAPVLLTLIALGIFVAATSSPDKTGPMVSAGLLILIAFGLTNKYTRRLSLTQNHLIVNTLLHKNRFTIHLSNIIIVSIETGISQLTINVAYYENGQTMEVSERCNLSKHGIYILAGHLKSLGVTVELDGKLVK